MADPLDDLDVADLIRELRHRLNLTQEELSAKLGVSFATVNRWENRHSRPSKLAVKSIRKLTEELGESGQDLLKYFHSLKK